MSKLSPSSRDLDFVSVVLTGKEKSGTQLSLRRAWLRGNGRILLKESIGLKLQYKLAVITAFLIAGAMVALSHGTHNDIVDKLTFAAASGDLSKVRSMLDRGALVDALDREGKTALMSASKNGHRDVIELLLEKGAEINAKGRYGKSAMMPASAEGHGDVVSLLLDRGANVNARDEYHQTALMCAALRGHAEVVEILLERGADINVKTRKGFTAMSLASEQGHQKVVEILFNQKPEPFLCDCQIRRSRYR
jgi:ankyrin repeat protein